jgi:anaerobic selenocysteine-containing dehydrogenase
MNANTKIEVKEGFSVHNAVCPHDCPDSCLMLVTRDDSTGKAIRVQGDPTHPITQGHLCNKVNHYLDYVYNDNRVMYPHKRVGPKGPGAKFERISWDEALETVTNNFKQTINEYGSEAVQPYSYSGTMGMVGFWALDQRFWNKMEAARLEQTICIYAAMWAGLHTYGLANADMSIHEAAQEADLIILWGANLVSTGVHAIPFIKAAQERGARLIVIDPRETRTTLMADWHIQPRPGTDAALALGMMKVIVDHNLHDIEFLEEQTKGWKELLTDKLPEYTLEKVEEITGVSASDIKKLALEYGSTKKSVIRANYGLNRHQNSGQTCRAILTLPAITGAWREKCGGASFGNLEEMWLAHNLPALHRTDLGNRASKRQINMVQLGKAINENIGENGVTLDPPIKSMFVYNSDPANCTPNSNSVRAGFMRDDLFVAVHDTFWSDTCDYADIVLPADTQLERMDLFATYGNWYFGMNEAVIEPLGESVSNQDLFRKLADKMGYIEDTDNAFTQTDEEIIRDILVDGEFNPLMEGVNYEELKEKGWARANTGSSRRNFLVKGWPTASGKIEIYCEPLKEQGVDPLPSYVPETEGCEDPKREQFPLQMLSCAAHNFIGDSFQQVPRLQAMMSRPSLEISPLDAQSRDIKDGQLCRLYNDRGETFAHAVIINKMLPGVVNTQKQFKGSNTYGGVNANALNTEMLTDFGNSPTFYSCLIEVEVASEKTKKEILKSWGGEQGYIRRWREDSRNKGIEATDSEIITAAKATHTGVFE